MIIPRFVLIQGVAFDLLAYGTGQIPVLAATVAPTITGTLSVGSTVIADPGTWNATPDSYNYVWKRGGVPIPQGVGASYLLQPADAGSNTITVDVTATKTGWTSGTATSAAATITSGTPDPGLWFEKSDPAGSPKKWFGHFFGSFPITHSNPGPSGPPTNNDYWETGFLAVQGESNKHLLYGGYVRDRPAVDQIPFPGTNTWGVAGWRRQMQNREIQNAIKYGCDGLLTDLLWMSGDNWLRIVELFDAASANFPGFNVIPMLDADISSSITFATIVANLTTLLQKSCNFTLQDGSTVLASYRPEARGVQFWTDLRNALIANGITVTYWHCFLNTSTAANYPNKTICGAWDTGTDPGIVLSGGTPSWITQARSRGEGILHPVWWQNIRMINSDPNATYPGGIHFAESLNTGGLRANWQRVIERNAEYVQLATWDDFGEQGHHKPSVMRGENALALDCWFAERWKTGAYPTILSDAVFVSYRPQMFGVESASLNTTITKQTQAFVDSVLGAGSGETVRYFTQTSGSNRSAVREHVEVLTFLTATDNVTITVGSTTHGPFSTAAGMVVRTVPMEFGNVTVTTGRGVTVNCPIPIRSTSAAQDRQYVVASNMNSIEQYNPTPAS